MSERGRRWVRRIVVAVAAGVPATALLLFAAFEVSSQPRFCGSCHIMVPYYDSWRHSSHSDIACVECHIPPGIGSELRKKYEALSMVVRYFTATYSTNPWTEVDDQSCLRSGCHARRLLLGQEVYQGVLFDHQPHMGALRRGKQLRCTSCHSQIVQGSHIAVTASTCFLCHFKGTATNNETGRCTLCHVIPEKTITTAGLSFDHGEVKRLGMNCVSCHEGVVQGDGAVPRERCVSCHSEPARLGRYGDTEFLHRKHVSDHKVECLNCHIEISHGIPAAEQVVASGCDTCHTPAAGHAPVRDLYRGIGGAGVPPRPAAMFLAGVRCEACHNRPGGEHATADEVSCMACHGPRYLTMYRSWQAGLGARLDSVRQELAAAAARLEVAKPPAAAVRDGVAVAAAHEGTADALHDARANVALVERGRAIHNPAYARDLLESAHRTVASALAAAGVRAPASPPWVAAPYESECLSCHFGVELLTGMLAGRELPHAPHVVAARLRCTSCHGDSSAHGTTRIGSADCDGCHARMKRPMAGVGNDECLGCHAAAIGPVSEAVTFPHEKHAAAFDCTACHGAVTERPHGTLVRSGEASPPLGHEFCGTCHAGDVPAADGTIPDGATCATCHPGME